MRAIRKTRGFTLVELMIVVAIVGVLAALAIYGVRRYITNAKTAEARNAIGRLAKDAASAYNREGMAATVLALSDSTGVSNRLCAGGGVGVPASADSIKGKKYQSNPTEWQTGTQWAGWQCVKFSMSDPQYYQYTYSQTGSVDDTTGAFAAGAAGNLDGDGNLSGFVLAGQIQGDAAQMAATLAPNIAETDPDE